MGTENIMLISKLADCLSKIGINNSLSDKYIKYFKGEKAELNPLDKANRIDVMTLPYDIQHLIKNTSMTMKDDKAATTYYERILNIMIDLGGISFLNSAAFYLHGFNKNGINELLNYDIPKTVVICWMLETSVSSDYSREFNIKLFVIDKLEELYVHNEVLLEEAFKECSINAQLFLAAFIVHKDKRKYKDSMEWLEEVIKNSLGELFSNKVPADGIDLIVKYVNGGFLTNDKMIPNIAKAVDFNFVDSYLLQLLLGISYITLDGSNIARRFVKLMVMLNYEKSLNAIYKCIKNDTYDETGKVITMSLSEAIIALDIPRELYIAWMGSRSVENSREFDTAIREELKKDRKVFDKAVNLNTNWGTIYLNRFLWEQNENMESYTDIEDTYIQTYEKYFNSLNIPKNIYDAYIDFLLGKKELAEIKDSARKVLGKQTVYSYQYSEFFQKISWTKNVASLYNRSICLFVYSRSNYTLENIAHDVLKKNSTQGYQKYIKLIENSGVDKDGIIPLIVDYACGQYYCNPDEPAKAFIADQIKNSAEEVAGYLGECSANGRVYLLEELFNADKPRFLNILLKYTNDSSKAVREKIVELLGGYREAFDEVVKLLSDKKQTARECGIHILSIWNDEKSIEVLCEAMVNEKNDKLKTSIANILKITRVDDEEAQGDINIIDYCKRGLKKIRGGSLSWLDLEALQTIRLINSDEAADSDLLKYLILSYATNNMIGSSLEAKKVSKYLSQQGLSDVALEILNRWIENGAESKKKWVMALAAIHGDDRVVLLLKKKIEEWPEHSRGAIACDAIYALALSGSSLSLMIIDNISRKFKFRQVKEAAAGAFAFAAKELGVDAEELSDKIVPNMGFDQSGERAFDFGPRKFKVLLSPTLELEVFDENEKKMKTLPVSGKNDNEEKAQQSIEEFKSLKKQLKSVVSIQTIRLESALSTDRKWTKESWSKLFVENPIMHKFAIGLIWGTYQDGLLRDTFRYMEDGSYNTKDEEEYVITEDLMIGLIHPIELDEEELSKWKTQLEDYEVKQPFEQILRKVYRVTNEEKEEKFVVRYGGILINGLSLLGKLTKFGWYRGSVQDGGCYYSFYKEDNKIGIGVELQFSGVGVGNENEEVTIYEIIFYRSGTVQRGSYVYDMVDDNNLIKPADVPVRFFSEILYDADRATSAQTGTNENWKQSR